MECGNWLGLWSGTQLCVWTGNTYKSPPPFEGLIDCEKDAHWFGCDGPKPMATSCYQNITFGSECCGCPHWDKELGMKIPTNDKDCQGHSDIWMKKVLPWDRIFKRACPTCYVYQYDDETSTFTCQSAESHEQCVLCNHFVSRRHWAKPRSNAASNSSTANTPSDTCSANSSANPCSVATM